jgi:diadenylate cyclase
MDLASLSYLRWQDLLDVALLSFLFYRILVLIKGTRTIPMLMGMFTLIGLYVLSRLFQLDATGLLMDNLANSLVLVLIILFQGDIRNALAQFGLIALFRDQSTQQRDVAEQVLSACRKMAKRKIGALVVFEQEVGLRNFTDRGTVINGSVSESLLLCIFHPTSPLHDGAVVLNTKGDLVAAKCILPVSNNHNLPAMLGTRHRAAIGLSEETDAIVLVVSEERRELSLSYKGQLLRDTEAKVEQALLMLLSGRFNEVQELMNEHQQTSAESVDETEPISISRSEKTATPPPLPS